MPFKLIAATMLALFLAACNPMEQLDLADQQIEGFHATYNSGDVEALYALTGQEFQDATSIEQMGELYALVNDRMGTVESSERASFNLDSNNGQTISTVTMTTQFTKGQGTETYTFFGTGDDLRLVGWNVDSPNFVAVPDEAVTPVEGVETAEEPAE